MEIRDGEVLHLCTCRFVFSCFAGFFFKVTEAVENAREELIERRYRFNVGQLMGWFGFHKKCVGK